MAILVSDKADFRAKNTRDKDNHFKMIKWSILQDAVTTEIFTYLITVLKYKKQKVQGKIGKSINIV